MIEYRLVKINWFEVDKVQFYGVIIGNHTSNEYEKFDTYVETSKRLIEHYEDEYWRILVQMEMMNDFGSFRKRFYEDSGVFYLKDSNTIKTGIGLTLFCIRISNEIVILMNGRNQTCLSVSDCKNLKPHYDTTAKLQKAIRKQIKEGIILVDGKNMNPIGEDSLRF